MHGSLPGLAAGRFGVIMFFFCLPPSFLRSGGPAVTCIRESNHHRYRPYPVSNRDVGASTGTSRTAILRIPR